MAEKPSQATETTRPEDLATGRWGWPSVIATVLALGLIGAWIAWWVASIRQDSLVLGRSTWVPTLPFLAGDYKVSIDHIARVQASGIDPYRNPNDWVAPLYLYPPMVARVFSWVTLFDVPTSIKVWLASLAVILTIGAVASWRVRRTLGLTPLPLACLVTVALYGSPTILTMERGQTDPLILLPFLAAIWLLGRRGAWPEVAAGLILGATAWLKYYPGVTLIALAFLGRRKAVLGFVAAGALIGIVDLDGVREAMKHASFVQQAFKPDRPEVLHPVQHWIVAAWNSNPIVKATWPLKLIPAMAAEVVLLVPLVLLVSRKVLRSADPDRLLLPYFCWLTSATTFALPGSHDYNLTLLPLAALAVWDRRDSWRVHAALACSLIWLQPFQVPVSGQVLMGLKLAALYAVGVSLSSRASELTIPTAEEARADLFRPAFAKVRAADAFPISGEPAPPPRSS